MPLNRVLHQKHRQRRFAARRAVRRALTLASCLATLAGLATRVEAQAPASTSHADHERPAFRVAVLRGTEGDVGELAGAIDAALLRDLAAIAGIEDPTVSPIDYAEIGLTVGCSDGGRGCLVAIAQMLQVDAVVVRRLSVDRSRAQLSLVFVDARASSEPVVAQREVARGRASEELPSAVPVLIRVLFGIPEPVAAAPVEAAGGSEPGSPAAEVGSWTWITLGAGGAILAAGLAMGASASSEFDSFKALPVRTRAEADRARARFDTVETKALAANVMIPSGAALLGLGALLLVLDLQQEPERPRLVFEPQPGGLMVRVHARAGGL